MTKTNKNKYHPLWSTSTVGNLDGTGRCSSWYSPQLPEVFKLILNTSA